MVTAARRGDRAAFAELYRRFSRAVHGVVLARVPYRDAADLVQDVFASRARAAAAARRAAAFPGWLLAIARNRAIDHLRAQRRPTSCADLPVDGAAVARGRAGARRALRALPEAYQRDADPAARRGHDRARDRGADRAVARLGARQPAPWHEAPARAPRDRARQEADEQADDYLWDGPGPPDPEVERLEELLHRSRTIARSTSCA